MLRKIEKTLIVSPSGNFYGSEQTLYTFLKNTKYNYTVLVRKQNKSFLYNELKRLDKHNLLLFRNVKILYLKIFFLLLFNKYNTIYINEAGHIRYAKIIAKIFPKKNIIIHVRLIEDTVKSRIGSLPENIELISVSGYIKQLLTDNCGIQTNVISSPFRGKVLGLSDGWVKNTSIKTKIGIVGRVTQSKGIKDILDFLIFLDDKNISSFEFHFFGEVELHIPEVNTFLENDSVKKTAVFHGFSSKETIYSNVDIILHLNKKEPLGVIFFESLINHIPFIGFNLGGIGFIAKTIGLADCMIGETKDWKNELLYKILNYKDCVDLYDKALGDMIVQFAPEKYCTLLEEVFHQTAKK